MSSVIPNPASFNFPSLAPYHLEVPQEGQHHLQELLLCWLCAQSFLYMECGYCIAFLAAAGALNKCAPWLLGNRNYTVSLWLVVCQLAFSNPLSPQKPQHKSFARILYNGSFHDSVGT